MNPRWAGFTTGFWQKEIDVRDFIQQNYTPYEGDESFLASASERTKKFTKYRKTHAEALLHRRDFRGAGEPRRS